jgi:GT2 family glycosyltransferase
METTTLPRVALILVNWNGKSDTLECLASISAIEYPNVQVIVVDNDSHDDSVQAIQTAFPQITILENSANLGFTGGNNVGIKHALRDGADYLFLLNNDTTIEAQAIGELVRVAQENSRFGLLSPIVHYYDNPDEPWFAGAQLDLSRGMAVHDNSQPPHRTDPVRQLPWASGCTMFLPAEVMRRVKGFDDRFFLNWEDVDLSLRVRRAGFKIGLVPSSRVLHKVGKSLNKRASVGTGYYYWLRNNLLLVRLHSGRCKNRATVAVIGRQLRGALIPILRREKQGWKILQIMLRAWKDHVFHRYGTRPH